VQTRLVERYHVWQCFGRGAGGQAEHIAKPARTRVGTQAYIHAHAWMSRFESQQPIAKDSPAGRTLIGAEAHRQPEAKGDLAGRRSPPVE
jgi:ATP-dependent protease ClpP protease subunit